MEKNIMELIGAIKVEFMEEIRTVVRETMEDVLKSKPSIEVQEEVKTPVKEVKAKKEIVEEVEETVEDTVEEDKPSRRDELKAMSYNDLKTLVKSLGGKAVGKAEVIIDRILELESELQEDEEEEEETLELDETPIEEVEESDDEEEVEEDVEEEDEDEDEDEEEEFVGHDEDESEVEKEFYDFLMELDNDDLLEIGAKLDYGKPKNWDKEGFVNLLLANLEQLQDALDSLGYYDEDEEEDESEEEVDAEDNSLKAQLEALTLEELADLCDENELSKKGKKQALVDRLLKAQAEGTIELDLDGDTESDEEESEEDEWYTQEELEELDDEDLIEIGKVNELEIPYVKKKNKKTLDRATLIDAILSLSDEGEESDEEVIEEEDANESESSTSQFEVSEERYEKEQEIEEEIRAKYKAKKLKDAVIKKFLAKYNEGNPTYKVPSASEALEEYIAIKTSMVDDDGESFDLEDCYVRDGNYFCCGKELTDLDKEPYCSVCGTIYEA